MAVCIRIVLISGVQWTNDSDSRDYHVLAQNILQHGEYKQEYHGETEAFNGFTFRAYRMPGYPIVLAGLYKVSGWDPTIALYFNVLLEQLSMLAIVFLGRRLFSDATALIAQAFYAVYLLFCPMLLTETLFTTLSLWCLVLLSRRIDCPGKAIAAGLLAAVTIFVRPIGLALFLPALVSVTGAKELSRKAAALMLVLFALPAVLAVSAWTVRNYRIFGEFVPFSTNLGTHIAHDFGLKELELFGKYRAQGKNEAQINRAILDDVGKKISADPGLLFTVMGERFLGLLSTKPNWDIRDFYSKGFCTGAVNAWAVYEISFDFYRRLMPLGWIGLIVWLIRKRKLGIPETYLAATLGLHMMLSEGNIRFAAPLYPLLCLYGADLVALSAMAIARRLPFLHESGK